MRTVRFTQAGAGLANVVFLNEFVVPCVGGFGGQRDGSGRVRENGRFPARLLSTVRMGRPRSSPSLRGLGMPHPPVILMECGFGQMFAGCSQ